MPIFVVREFRRVEVLSAYDAETEDDARLMHFDGLEPISFVEDVVSSEFDSVTLKKSAEMISSYVVSRRAKGVWDVEKITPSGAIYRVQTFATKQEAESNAARRLETESHS